MGVETKRKKTGIHLVKRCFQNVNITRQPVQAHTITLKNRQRSWTCLSGESVVQRATRQGIELPTSCRNGTCRTCLIPSSKGAVEHLIEWPGLSLEEKRQGALLPCVAGVTSDLEIEDAHLRDAIFEQAFHLLYEDPELLVLNKPSGLLAVPGKGVDKLDSLSHRVQMKYPSALIVHRLDQATSGLMLMAQNPDAQRALSRHFSDRSVDKRYLAKVQASLTPSPEWQTIDEPIYADWSLRPKRVIDALGQASLTRWRVLHSSAGFSWLELQPMTGRTHQLRLHLSHMGWPIVGDRLYAPESIQALSERMLLHAWKITFQHPVSQEIMQFEATAPQALTGPWT